MVGARAGKYILGARAGKYKFGATAGKHKVGVTAGNYKFGAGAVKNKLGPMASKYKLRASVGDRGQGPGSGPRAKQRAGGREIQTPKFCTRFLLTNVFGISFILFRS